tara:strand:+ start:6375 stop:6881 length:507 start_codon:yes stop_codon:yes gene_type:complete
MKNRKIIITGPPGSGKSTIIQALIKKKYTCFKEINPSNIDNKKVRESKQLLSEFIFKKRLEDYHSAKNNLTFFDRSTIDVIAYLNYWKLNHPHEWIKIIKNQNYFINVFYAPFWSEIYTTNNYRKENLKEAMLIDKFLRNLFLKFNFNLIELPKTNIENRIEFITNQI